MRRRPKSSFFFFMEFRFPARKKETKFASFFVYTFNQRINKDFTKKHRVRKPQVLDSEADTSYHEVTFGHFCLPLAPDALRGPQSKGW